MDSGRKVPSLLEIYSDVNRLTKEALAGMDVDVKFYKEEEAKSMSLLKPAPDLLDEDVANNNKGISASKVKGFPAQIVVPPGREIPENLLDRVTLPIATTSELVKHLMSPNLITWGCIQKEGGILSFQFLFVKTAQKNRPKAKRPRVVPMMSHHSVMEPGADSHASRLYPLNATLPSRPSTGISS